MTDTTPTWRWGHLADVKGAWKPPLPEYAVYHFEPAGGGYLSAYVDAMCPTELEASTIAAALNHLEQCDD